MLTRVFDFDRNTSWKLVETPKIGPARRVTIDFSRQQLRTATAKHCTEVGCKGYGTLLVFSNSVYILWPFHLFPRTLPGRRHPSFEIRVCFNRTAASSWHYPSLILPVPSLAHFLTAFSVKYVFGCTNKLIAYLHGDYFRKNLSRYSVYERPYNKFPKFRWN